jgi:serine/threonine protein kinase
VLDVKQESRWQASSTEDNNPYDKSVDVFSFAMMLYEMFEGLVPFEVIG